MTITAKIIEDSINDGYTRITTFELTYPRFIHSELMTHRVFSRNASSSRAIPVKRMIENIIADTAMPIHWGKNQPGMQADEENNTPITIDGVDYSSKEVWLMARDAAINFAELFHEFDFHKQIVNRLLEPFMHITVIVTSTEWSNWYDLRDHKDAQPEIQELAIQMRKQHKQSDPTEMRSGEWHLPYVTEAERCMYNNTQLAKISTARCCRVSYLTHDGKTPSFEADMKLFDRLVGSVPLHASPLEHIASPIQTNWRNGNFRGGWMQFRKVYEGDVYDYGRFTYLSR